jgi:NADPH:quinone reductase
MATNRQIKLAARPVGYPKQTDFKMVESAAPTPSDGEILLRTLYLSVDPYMRGRMRDVKSYVPPFQIDEVITGGGVAKIVESKNPDFRPGDIVEGMLGWQDYNLSNGQGLRKFDPSLAPITTALGVLGMPGLTSYFGLLDICDPQPGETVVVSGAAGAVGSIVGQIAKIKGCRVVGIAGADDKIDHLINDLGFDAAFNYKTVSDYYAKLGELCPGGIDVYFDNVGGPITDAVFMLINTGARISVCGQISQYNLEQLETGPRMLWALTVKQAKAEGFIVTKYADRYAEALTEMVRWIKEGRLKYREDIAEGLENTPNAFIGMLKGQNIGKQLVKVSEA